MLRIVRCLCGRSVELDLMGADGLEALAAAEPAAGRLGRDAGREGRRRISLSVAVNALGVGGALRLRACERAHGLWRRLGDPRAPVGRQLQAARQPRPAAEPAGRGKLTGTAEAFELADRALVSLAAISGLAQENVNRVAGWRFLDIGRRIERAINTCRFARNFAGEKATADDLDVLLDLIDSQITYRSRYLTGVALAPVRDMVLLDPFNPRSVSFQIEQIRRHLDTLPTLNEDGIPEEPKRIIELVGGEIGSTAARDVDTQHHPRLRAEADEVRRRAGGALLPAAAGRAEDQEREWPCVIYDIRHVTSYAYEFPVSSATLSLRVTPRSGAGPALPRSRADHRAAAEDAAASRRDFFGNSVTMATIDTGADGAEGRGARACRYFAPADRAGRREPGLEGDRRGGARAAVARRRRAGAFHVRKPAHRAVARR